MTVGELRKLLAPFADDETVAIADGECCDFVYPDTVAREDGCGRCQDLIGRCDCHDRAGRCACYPHALAKNDGKCLYISRPCTVVLIS